MFLLTIYSQRWGGPCCKGAQDRATGNYDSRTLEILNVLLAIP
nr:MAG TPA: hypothetical protein [Caudoviricetes sp.]DAX18501.1 MAG TPA: hypothetical protein [Caudoviricetes sp.]